MKILVLNGPNLNMLGIRDPEIYGRQTYRDLEEYVDNVCRENDIEYEMFQTNREGELVDKIQQAYGVFDGIVINPAAYTHTSIAILDAVKAVGIPTVEVHLSKVSEREDFRQISYIRLAAAATITGKGFEGYGEAILWLKENC